MSEQEPTERDVELILREGGAAIVAAPTTDALAQVETELFGKRSALSDGGEDLGKAQAAEVSDQQKHGKQEAEVADTVDDESFFAGAF